jgi:hypothetical protein
VSRDNVYFLRIDELRLKPAEVQNWVVLIYEGQQRFRQENAKQMVTDLVKACEAVGRAIQASLTATSCTEFS